MKNFRLPDGCNLVYTDEGEGPPLLMLHGWSQSAAMFHHQIADLRRSYRVIAPDLRGHGLSDKPAHGYRMEALAADVNSLLDHLKLAKTAALGWSMGASVLWSFADIFGLSRFERLVFVDEPACVVQLPGMTPEDITDAGAIFDLAGLQGLIGGLLGPDSAAVRKQFVDGMLSPDADAAMRGYVLEENLKMPATAAAALLLNHATQDWRDLIPRLDRPALVIGGHVSHVNPQSQRWIANRLPNARLEIISAKDRGSHFPFLENPSLFNSLLRDFLGN